MRFRIFLLTLLPLSLLANVTDELGRLSKDETAKLSALRPGGHAIDFYLLNRLPSGGDIDSFSKAKAIGNHGFAVVVTMEPRKWRIFYGNGEGYSDRRENRVDVRDGPFVVGRIQLRF